MWWETVISIVTVGFAGETTLLTLAVSMIAELLCHDVLQMSGRDGYRVKDRRMNDYDWY